MGNLDSHNDSDVDSEDMDSSIGFGELGVQQGHNWTEEEKVCCGLANITNTRREITGLSQLMRDRFKSEEIKQVMKAIPREHFVYNTGAKIQSVHYDLDAVPSEDDEHHVCFAPRREVHNNSTYVRILEILQLKPGYRFLHLGSGTGYLNTLAGMLIGASGVNHGVEVNAGMLEYAEERQKALRDHCDSLENFEYCEPNFVLGDCLKLDPTPQYYDRIYCSGMLPQGYCNFLQRFLKIDGLLVYPRDCRTFVTIEKNSEHNYTMESERANLRVYPFMSDEKEGFSNLPEKNFPTLQELSRAAVRIQIRKSLLVKHEKSSENSKSSKRKSETDEIPEIEESNHQNKKLKVPDSESENSSKDHESDGLIDYIDPSYKENSQSTSNANKIPETDTLKENIDTNDDDEEIPESNIDEIKNLNIDNKLLKDKLNESKEIENDIPLNEPSFNIINNPEVDENIHSTVTVSTSSIDEPSNSSNNLDENNYDTSSHQIPIDPQIFDDNNRFNSDNEQDEDNDSEYTTVDEDSDSDENLRQFRNIHEEIMQNCHPLRMFMRGARPAGESSDDGDSNGDTDDESSIEDDMSDDDDDFFTENDYCEACHMKMNESLPKEVKKFNPNVEYDINTLNGNLNLLPLPKDIKLYLKYKNNLISL